MEGRVSRGRPEIKVANQSVRISTPPSRSSSRPTEGTGQDLLDEARMSLGSPPTGRRASRGGYPRDRVASLTPVPRGFDHVDHSQAPGSSQLWNTLALRFYPALGALAGPTDAHRFGACTHTSAGAARLTASETGPQHKDRDGFARLT
jgi:hypothetical protein